MRKTEKITVNGEHSYDILVGDGIFNNLPRLISPFVNNNKVLIVTDDIVDKLYGESLESLLSENGYIVKKFVFSNGESSKSSDTLLNILNFAIENGFNRHDLFLSLGGGVVSDLTGLSSALYMRGVPFVAVPTTLLAATDASVGGKTAVNLKNGKNSMGTFYSPKAVFCDTDIIKNLPAEIFSLGMAEVIKTNLIKDFNLFSLIEENTVKENIEKIIVSCLKIKKEIVEKDEYDTKGIRNVLNMGHTVGHALEILCEYKIPHGLAVGTGLCKEAEIAEKSGLTDNLTVNKIKAATKKYGLLIKIPYSPSDLICAMLSDKKNTDSKITFLLPENNGKIKEIKLSESELIDLL